MHSDTKFQLKSILGIADPAEAQQLWLDLQPTLDLHEELEDEFVYAPLAEEYGPGTPLGDWLGRHDSEVAIVKQLVAKVEAQQAGHARVAHGRQPGCRCAEQARHRRGGPDLGRVQQAWDLDRLESVGAAIEEAKAQKLSQPAAATRTRPSRAGRTGTSQKPAAAAGRRH